MGDIYSFGSMYIQSKVLKEIFEQDDELKDLIIDDEDNVIDTNFNGNDQVRFPIYESDIVKTLDEFIDYLTLIDDEGGIVGNFESFGDLEWGEDNPQKKKIIDQMVSKKSEIIDSIESASLIFSASGYHPNDDTALIMIRNFIEEYEDEYFSVNSIDVTISYEYEKGKNSWHVEGEFHVDFLDEPIIIDVGNESTTDLNPKKQKRKKSPANRPVLHEKLEKHLNDFIETYQSLDIQQLESYAIEYGTKLLKSLKEYESKSGTSSNFVLSGISALPIIIDGLFSIEEFTMHHMLVASIPGYEGFPDETLISLSSLEKQESFVEKITELLDILIAKNVIDQVTLVMFLLVVALADGTLMEAEKSLISSFLMTEFNRPVYRLYEKYRLKSFLTMDEVKEYVSQVNSEDLDFIVSELESYGVEII